MMGMLIRRALPVYSCDVAVILARDPAELTCNTCGGTIPPDHEHYATYTAEMIGRAFIETCGIQCCDCTEAVNTDGKITGPHTPIH